MFIYYIDASVLLGNTPLVKFIETTTGIAVAYFPYLSCEDIDDVIYRLALFSLRAKLQKKITLFTEIEFKVCNFFRVHYLKILPFRFTNWCRLCVVIIT